MSLVTTSVLLRFLEQVEKRKTLRVGAVKLRAKIVTKKTQRETPRTFTCSVGKKLRNTLSHVRFAQQNFSPEPIGYFPFESAPSLYSLYILLVIKLQKEN